MQMPRRRVVCVVLLALFLPAVKILPVYAFDTVSLTLGDIGGAGWSAQNVVLHLDWTDAAHARVLLQASSATLPEKLGKLASLELVCTAAEITVESINCPQGTLAMQSTVLGRQNMSLAFRYRFSDGQLTARVRNIRYLGGQLALKARYSEAGWTVDVNATGASLAVVTEEQEISDNR